MQGDLIGKFHETPFVTIITVVFNGSSHLEEAILSVLNQSYYNIEYVIIDGGSTDATLDIIKKYDKKIDYWISEPDKGIYDAMNKGIHLATGRIIGLVNADDYLNSGIVEKIAHCFVSNPEIGFTYGSVDLIRESGKVYGKTNPFPDDEIYSKRFHDIPFAHPSCFILKSVYNQIGLYDTNFPLSADYDLILRMIGSGFRGKNLHLSVSRFREGGKSGGLKSRIENLRMHKKHGLNFFFRNKIFLSSVIKLVVVNIIPYRFTIFIKRFRKKSRHDFII